MASGAKKRRSRSLSQKTASKRVRHPSSSPSHSAPPKKQIPKTKTSHLKSVSHENQDSYLPRSEEHATSLPTVDDWVFRAKVSSSSTDLTNNIFMKAVQGLVKICFPDGVLEQLGIQLVEQHMHEENAPGKNNCKMVRIFRAEMAHRVTWMLAEYMDALTKLEAGEEAIVAASASLHGFKLGYDILGHVVTSSGHRRDRVPSGSTRRLSEGATLQRSTTPDLSVQREELVNLTSDAFESEQFAVEEGPPPPSPLERTEQNGLIERHPKREEAPDEKAMDAVYPTVPIRAARDNKVSRNMGMGCFPRRNSAC